MENEQIELGRKKNEEKIRAVAGYLRDPLVYQAICNAEFSKIEQPIAQRNQEEWVTWWNMRIDLFASELQKLNPDHPLLKQL